MGGCLLAVYLSLPLRDRQTGEEMTSFSALFHFSRLCPSGYEHTDASPGLSATILMCDIAEGSECANTTILD